MSTPTPHPGPGRHAQVERIELLGDSVRALHLKVEGQDPFTFLPGQWVALRFEHEGRFLSRSYSIASPRCSKQRFEVCVKHTGSGAGSHYVWSLQPGDRVEFSGPSGTFLLREPISRGAIFVANGTGISPFRPMLHRALPHSNGQPITLLLGTRAQGDLLYGSEWEELEGRYPNFRFLPTLSRPEPGWEGRKGYVQDVTPDLLNPVKDADVYICGLNPMVDTVRRQCREWGYPDDRVHYERYD